MVELISIKNYFDIYIRLSDANCYLFYHQHDNEDIDYNKRYLDKYNFYPCLESFTEMINFVLVNDEHISFDEKDREQLLMRYNTSLRSVKINQLKK